MRGGSGRRGLMRNGRGRKWSGSCIRRRNWGIRQGNSQPLPDDEALTVGVA
jgi:hypothetical protein